MSARPSDTPWSDAQQAQLEAYRARRWTYRQIGEEMGLTVPMVCYRVRQGLDRARRAESAPPPLAGPAHPHLPEAMARHAARAAAMVRAGMALDAAANLVRQEAPDCAITPAQIQRVMGAA